MTVENREKLKYALAYHGLQPPSNKENLSEVENLYFQLISWGQQVRNFEFISLDKVLVHVSLILQIAMGMEFLAKNGIIHGDLATRNILLSCDLVAKLSDFGLSGRLPIGKQSIELTTTKCPIRWMAPESFRHRILTKATDIWSYGVVLWEIFALAERPYEGKKIV